MSTPLVREDHALDLRLVRSSNPLGALLLLRFSLFGMLGGVQVLVVHPRRLEPRVRVVAHAVHVRHDLLAVHLCGNQNSRRVLNRRVYLHAIDATPARWRGGVGLSPLDSVSMAVMSPRNDFVMNYRAHPTQ